MASEDKQETTGDMWGSMFGWMSETMTAATEIQQANMRAFAQSMELATSSTTRMWGQPVEMAHINASLLNIVAEHDHLVAQSQAAGLMDLVASEDKTLRVIPSTHVGIMISRRARYKLWPEVAAWLGERSD